MGADEKPNLSKGDSEVTRSLLASNAPPPNPLLSDGDVADVSPPHAAEAPADPFFPDRRPALEIPGYRIVRELSRGGQGVVYQAVQESTHRKVAIKVLIEGPYASKAARRRFEREVDLAANLKHPHIIAVFDSGTTADGHLYYVMDYVRGVPITQYVRENRLPLEKVLELFATACDAVNHAHQKGVIHRDLKPSNMLVDAEGNLRILDFGLAKVVTESTESLVSVTGQVVGTLPYMSPEQTKGNPDLIDIRTDVYALGVVLYEMLTGAYPYPVVGEMAEVLKHIVTTEPRPLTRSWTKESGIAGRARRGLSSRACPIDGEIETITLRALAKERERRYQSAGELAQDVRHYLAGEPIDARRDSGMYLLKKALWRHRAGVAVLAAFALLLIAFSVAMTVSRNRAKAAEREAAKACDAEAEQRLQVEAERDRARAAEAEAHAVLGFFEDKVLAAARPEGQQGGLGPKVTIRAAIDAAEPLIAETFKDRPLVEASIRRAMGATYCYLGEYSRAIRQHERSLALYRSKLGPNHPDTLRSMYTLAVDYHQSGRSSEAVSLLENTLSLQKAKLGPDHPDTLASMGKLAWTYHGVGRLTEAIGLFEATLQLQKVKLGPDHPETLFSMDWLAHGYRASGRMAEAVSLFEEAFRLCRTKLGSDHPETLSSMFNLAVGYVESGRPSEAVPLYEETLKFRKAKLGPNHPETLWSMDGLALAYCYAGRGTEAVPLAEEMLRLSKAKFGPDDTMTLSSMRCLAESYRAVGRMDEALSLFEETLKLQQAKLGRDDYVTLFTMQRLASCYRASGRSIEAIRLLEEEIKLRKATSDPDDAYTLIAVASLADCYLAAGRLTDALPLYEEVLKFRKAKLGPDHPNTLRCAIVLLATYARSGRFEQALQVSEGLVNRTPADHWLLYTAAILRVRAGDLEGYRQTARRMLELFADTQERHIADRVAKAYLLVADSRVDLATAYRLADRAVSGPEHDWMHYFQLCKGLAEYRAGHYQSAVDWLTKNTASTRTNGPVESFTQASFILAMAHHKLGKPAEAARCLQEATDILDQQEAIQRQRGDLGPTFLDWIICGTLRSEAEALINGKPTTRPTPWAPARATGGSNVQNLPPTSAPTIQRGR